MKKAFFAVLVMATIVVCSASVALAEPLTGAAFTSFANGGVVNGNLYQAKEDMYLNGGPGPNAPQGAAGLPNGDYYFQITDPPGKTLLSVDPITSRKFQVKDGIIVKVYPALVQTKYQGKWYGTHLTGISIDHGAVTIQGMPYADTPNMGNVYKVWLTRVSDYTPGSGKFGFIPGYSKTDNFKVKARNFVAPQIVVRKFWDKNANGVWDTGEPELTDWSVNYTDPLGVPFGPVMMPYTVNNADTGAYTFTENMKDHWFQTAVYVDGVKQTLGSAVANVAGTSGETHTVVFGNAQRCNLSAFKFRDHNLNGVHDTGEDGVSGVQFTLTGTDLLGNAVGPLVATSGSDGYARWNDLLPGSYTIAETVPSGWFATTPTSQSVTLSPGDDKSQDFGNAQLVSVRGYKWYDLDGDGKSDVSEQPVVGWKLRLTGTDYLGNAVGPLDAYTGSDGYVTWSNLLPGNYTVTEIMPLDLGWFAVTPTTFSSYVAEGSTYVGGFGNAYLFYAGFRTKGFWHNQNGLAILDANPAWISAVNLLDPYSGNPFDGLDSGGNPVPAAQGPAGDTIAASGTTLAEISEYLVAPNAGGDPKIQLGEQLLAFIFNVRNTGAATIQLPDGTWATSGSVIQSAIAAWNAGGADANYWAGVLDHYNNLEGTTAGTGVPCISSTPGPIQY